jgi:hypothetical protein
LQNKREEIASKILKLWLNPFGNATIRQTNHLEKARKENAHLFPKEDFSPFFRERDLS